MLILWEACGKSLSLVEGASLLSLPVPSSYLLKWRAKMSTLFKMLVFLLLFFGQAYIWFILDLWRAGWMWLHSPSIIEVLSVAGEGWLSLMAASLLWLSSFGAPSLPACERGGQEQGALSLFPLGEDENVPVAAGGKVQWLCSALHECHSHWQDRVR